MQEKKGNIKIHIFMKQDKAQRRDLLNMVMSTGITLKVGNLLTS